MKIIAFYLPQFHTIPENDLWWGEGFTEWTNTRKARPLFAGHYQPREPKGDYYYDLTDSMARRWQAELAQKYGIFGFCYYHYWFKGKRLLEKPFNGVLESGEPDFPFCLSWANEPWTRRWDGREHDLLMPQDYGDESDWKEHYAYLHQAFSDQRYIRINGKPLFIIYRPASIPRCGEMLALWNKLAEQAGLPGIFFAQTLNGFYLPDGKGFDASIEFEPNYTIRHGCPRGRRKSIYKMTPSFKGKSILNFDYDRVWHYILNREPKPDGMKTFLGAFVDWDNSPRLGDDSSVFSGANPEKFGRYLSRQLRRARDLYKSEYVFINAWNEWAEGAYLEPDKKYGLQYLEAVRQALDSLEK